MSTRNPFHDLLDELAPPPLVIHQEEPPLEWCCPTCERLKPYAAFRLHPDDALPMGECLECELARPAMEQCQRQELAERARIQRGIHRLVAAATSRRPQIPTIETICSDLFQELGGSEQFAKEWKTEFDLAKPGSKMRLDHLKAVYQLAMMANNSRKDDLDVSTITEQQLESAVAQYAYRILRPEDSASEGGGEDDGGEGEDGGNDGQAVGEEGSNVHCA